MPYNISNKEKYLHIEWYGVFLSADLASIRRDLVQWAQRLDYAPNVLHTFDGVQLATLQPIEALDHAIQRKGTKLKNPAKSASVAKNELAYKMASLFAELNRNPSIEMRVFDSEEEAIAWLSC